MGTGASPRPLSGVEKRVEEAGTGVAGVGGTKSKREPEGDKSCAANGERGASSMGLVVAPKNDNGDNGVGPKKGSWGEGARGCGTDSSWLNPLRERL